MAASLDMRGKLECDHLMFEARFQSFDDSNLRAQSASRTAALRAEIKRRGLDGFVVPRADRQQNEYLPASEERLAWLTGFTGSAGAAIVLADSAALFVDGRYTLQADSQIDGTIYSIEHLVERPPDRWLEEKIKSGTKIGYDPWLHTSDQAEKLAKACVAAGAELVAVNDNPIDALWRDRPAPPAGMVTIRELKLAGESAPHKIKRIRAELTRSHTDALLVSDPQNVAWAFNIRGGPRRSHATRASLRIDSPRWPARDLRGCDQAQQQCPPCPGGVHGRSQSGRPRPRSCRSQGQDGAS